MRIYVPNNSEQEIGGGWSFLRNFQKGLRPYVEFVDHLMSCDIFFINSVSMTDRDEVEQAHQLGKKIVFRVDNIPKKSRNKRSRIYDNMKRYGEIADVVVFQSEWAKSYAGYLTGTDHSVVIYNGVDEDIFNINDRDLNQRKKYLFVHYNRDENKRFPEAAYYFHEQWKIRKDISFTIVGKFSSDLIDAGFDFFAAENVTYIPPIKDPKEMAKIYKSHDILFFPAFADASPNTVLEARACGMEVELVNPVGGTKELMNLGDISLERMCKEYLGLFNLMFEEKEIVL